MRRSVLMIIAAVATGCGSTQLDVRTPDPAVRAADFAGPPGGVEGDVRLVAALLHHVYAGRHLATDETWQATLDELGAIPGRASDSRTTCDAIGDALARLGQPAIHAIDAEGRRCGVELATRIGVARAGENVAANAADAFVFEERPSADGTIAILGIRTFDPTANWDGWAEALARLATHDSRIVDLRGAAGDDPSHALSLLDALGGPVPRIEPREPREPDWLGALHFEPTHAPFWSISPREGHAVPGTTRVLMDGGCANACELAAHALSLLPDAQLVGAPTAGTWVFGSSQTIELPWSHARIVLPIVGADVVPEPSMPGPVWPRTGSTDALLTAWTELERDQSGRARVARFASANPTCADAQPISRFEELSAEAMARVDLFLSSEIQEGGARIASGSVQVSLDAARTRTLLESCPGVSLGGSFTKLASGETITSLGAPASTWLMMVQLPVVVRADGQPPVHITAN